MNITGGADLTLGEVHQINEIIHDAVGDDAEIIFGAVHEPAMQGEIRVTVIATGFDKAVQLGLVTPAHDCAPVVAPEGRAGDSVPGHSSRARRRRSARARAPRCRARRARQLTRPRATASQDLSDMEIPTFIRRQMD